MEEIDVTSTMETKRNNDPWLPLPVEESHSSQVLIAPTPQNPLNDMIDSKLYIERLERKLSKLTKVQKQEPSSRDIITSLALFHDDQMRRYLSEPAIIDFCSGNRTDEPLPQASIVQRILHPEKQPLTAEEIAELLKEDILAKVFEQTESDVDSINICNISLHGTHSSVITRSAGSPAVADSVTVTNNEQINQENDINDNSGPLTEDWAHFDEVHDDTMDIDSLNSR